MVSNNIESSENIHVLYTGKQNLSQKVIIIYLSLIIPYLICSDNIHAQREYSWFLFKIQKHIHHFFANLRAMRKRWSEKWEISKN